MEQSLLNKLDLLCYYQFLIDIHYDKMYRSFRKKKKEKLKENIKLLNEEKNKIKKDILRNVFQYVGSK